MRDAGVGEALKLHGFAGGKARRQKFESIQGGGEDYVE